MAGNSPFRQPSQPPDPDPDSPLHPSQFPALSGSPSTSPPIQFGSNLPSFPWVFKNKGLDSSTTESSVPTKDLVLGTSAQMDISPISLPKVVCHSSGTLSVETHFPLQNHVEGVSTTSSTTQSVFTDGNQSTTSDLTLVTDPEPKSRDSGEVRDTGNKLNSDPFPKSSAQNQSNKDKSPTPSPINLVNISSRKILVDSSLPSSEDTRTYQNPPTKASGPNLNQLHPDTAPQTDTTPAPSWAEKAKIGTDRSLKRLAPVTFSATGVPQVRVPDAVFQRGAETHKDFVLGVFTGKTPSYSHIQSVLSHIWGRGVKLQIHLMPATRSMLVKIPNDHIRSKVVEQEIWHIGTSLFYVAQWTAQLALKQPSFTSIPLWAHVRGVPFDLYTQEGLSLVAGLIGDPVEADEFTIKMVSLDVAHLKVRANCTKQMLSTVELLRDNGSIISVSVEYPWLPPSCSCCKQLGHTEARCPNARWAPASTHTSGSTPASASTPASDSNCPPALAKDKSKEGVNQSSSVSTFETSAKGSTLPGVKTPAKIFKVRSKEAGENLINDKRGKSSLQSVSGLKPPGQPHPISNVGISIREPASGALVLSNKAPIFAARSPVLSLPADHKSLIINSTSASKKRKGSYLSRRQSPPTPATANPFACLDGPLPLVFSSEPMYDLVTESSTIGCSTSGTSDSLSLQAPGTTPFMGSSLQDGKKSS